MEKYKGRILWLSDSPTTNTGYSTQSRNLANYLTKKGWEIFYQGHNYVGQPIKNVTFEDDTRLNFTLLGGGRQPYCQDLLQSRLKKLQPDIFFVLLDTFMLYPWILKHNFSPAKASVFWFPSDGGGGLPQNCDQVLKHFTHPVAMAKFGQKQCKEIHDLNTHYIPHAIHEHIMKPVCDEKRRKIREEMVVKTITGTKIKGALVDKYVVGVMARNQGRKALDLSIKSFELFCRDKPNAVLYLHLDPEDPAATFDIRHLIVRHKLVNRVFFNPMKYYENLDYKDMYKVYNVMDVLLHTSTGEGFGCGLIEANACKIPIVGTDYTTSQQLIMENGQSGLVIPIAAEITGSWSVERAFCNINKASEILTHLYNNPYLSKKYGEAGREKVLKHYTWEVIGDAFDKMLSEAIKK